MRKREQNFVAANAELRAQLEATNDQIARMQIAYLDGILQVLRILLTIKQCRQHSESSSRANSRKIIINFISQHYCTIQEYATQKAARDSEFCTVSKFEITIKNCQ